MPAEGEVEEGHRYTPLQMGNALLAAGFTRAQVPIMVAIGLAESGGRNVTHVNRNGSTDYGVWQINSVHGFDVAELRTLTGNARAAKAVFDKQGLKAWVTYTSGAYRKYTSQGEAVKDTASGEVSGSGDGVTDTRFTGPLSFLNSLNDIWDPLGKALSAITDADFWKRAGIITLGILLGFVGIAFFLKNEAMDVVKAVK